MLQSLLSRFIDSTKKIKNGVVPNLSSVSIQHADTPASIPSYANDKAFNQALETYVKNNKVAPLRASAVDYNSAIPDAVKMRIADAVVTLGIVIGTFRLSDGTYEVEVRMEGYLLSDGTTLTDRFRLVPASKLTQFVPPQYRTPASTIVTLGKSDEVLLKHNNLDLKLEHKATGKKFKWITIDPRFVTSNLTRASGAVERKEKPADDMVEEKEPSTKKTKKAATKPVKRHDFLSPKLAAKLDTSKLIVEQAIQADMLKESPVSPSSKPDAYFGGSFFQTDIAYDPVALANADKTSAVDGANLSKTILMVVRNYDALLLPASKWLAINGHVLSNVSAPTIAEQYRTEQGTTRHDLLLATSHASVASRLASDLKHVIKHARVLIAVACVASHLIAVRPHETSSTACKSILTAMTIPSGTTCYAFDFRVGDKILVGLVEKTIGWDVLDALTRTPVPLILPSVPKAVAVSDEEPTKQAPVEKPKKQRKKKETIGDEPETKKQQRVKKVSTTPSFVHANVELPAIALGYDSAKSRVYLHATPGFQKIRLLAMAEGPSSFDEYVKQLVSTYTKELVQQVALAVSRKLAPTMASVLFQCIKTLPLVPMVPVEHVPFNIGTDDIMDIDEVVAAVPTTVVQDGPLVQLTSTIQDMKAIQRYNRGSEPKKNLPEFQALMLPLDNPEAVTPEQKAVVRVVFGGLTWG